MKYLQPGLLALALTLASTIAALSIPAGLTVAQAADEQAADQPAPPKRLSGTVPEYPALARRFNVHGAVLVRLTIDKKGRVEKTEILETPADILSDAVTRSVSDWKFTRPDASTAITMRVPFVLTGDEYAFDTAVRPLQSAPKDKGELGKDVTDGWSEIRLTLDGKGAVTGALVLKMSDPGFRATNEAILAALKFPAVPEGTAPEKSLTVNAFSIHVTAASQIEVKQLSGE